MKKPLANQDDIKRVKILTRKVYATLTYLT